MAHNDLFSLSSLFITPIKNTVRNSSHLALKKGKGTAKNINYKIHSSFNTILNDNSRGGVLISQVIYHIHDQNKLNLSLFLTSIGIKASHDLINMVNILPENHNSIFKGDNLLFEFLSNNFNKLFGFNMMVSLKTINPNIMYNLPLEYKKVIDGDCFGIYCFVHTKTGNYGVGSAISCLSRLLYHMNSFNGHRLRSHLHNWIMANGDVSSVKWAPIITYDNIVQ